MAQNLNNIWKVTFDVLEPVKAPSNPHRDIGILININDEQDKHNDLELRGSDLDNIKKQKFDLLDLYENIYVTPQHVRKPEEIVEKPHVDYEEFFQKLETEEKIDLAINPTTSKDYLLDSIIDDFDSNSVENLGKGNQSIHKPINDIIQNYIDIPQVLKVPVVKELKHDIEHVQKKIDNSFQHLTINMNKGIDVQETENNTRNNLIANFGNLNKFNDSASLLNKQFRNIDINKMSERSLQYGSIIQNFGSVNHLKDIIETINTVTLDKKTYAKQRQVRADAEKLGFTKGPDIYEKSVVLPQIMRRLTDRENALQEDTKMRRRLVLDSSKRLESQCQCSKSPKQLNERERTTEVQIVTKKPSIHGATNGSSDQVASKKDIKLNPIVALENCNRERLTAHRVHSAFEKYVLTGSYY